jgi:predicted secreted protein
MHLESSTSPAFVRRTLAALALAMAFRPALADSQPPPQNVVVLNATATLDVAEDWFTVVFSTSREAPDAGAVQAQLRQALDAALALARKASRPDELEVHTGDFSLFPRYSQPTSKPAAIVAWQGNAELIVEGRDAKAIAELTGRVQTMTIARVGFSLSGQARDRVEGEVTARAIERFRSRAAAVAKEFGFGGYLIREVTLSSDLPVPIRMPMAQAMSARAVANDALPVEAGKTHVSVTVSGSVQMK